MKNYPISGARWVTAIALVCGLIPSMVIAKDRSSTTSYARDDSERLLAKSSFVSIPVSDSGKEWSLGAVLHVPYGFEGKRPAVVIIHGSGGVDSRGGHYANALNHAGYVTLEVDLWAARGVQSAGGRPKSVIETLPDAFASLNFLTQMTGTVDSERIGITGFSWGGVVSMLSANRAYREKYGTGVQKCAAHAPFYPVCWGYNVVRGYDFKNLTGAKILIQAGKADVYDAPETCSNMVASLASADAALVELVMYDNATHAWDRREPDATVPDPASHVGKGGMVPLRYNAAVTRKSTEKLLEFFAETLGGQSLP